VRSEYFLLRDAQGLGAAKLDIGHSDLDLQHHQRVVCCLHLRFGTSLRLLHGPADPSKQIEFPRTNSGQRRGGLFVVAVFLGSFGFGLIVALLCVGTVLPQIIPLDRIYQRVAPVRHRRMKTQGRRQVGFTSVRGYQGLDAEMPP
jgi:hypothetical protein